jgi:hypothetical protein
MNMHTLPLSNSAPLLGLYTAMCVFACMYTAYSGAVLLLPQVPVLVAKATQLRTASVAPHTYHMYSTAHVC